MTGTDVGDHLRNLESVLDSLQKHGIKAKESKCTFMGESIQYLGHVVDRAGIHPLPDRVKAIVDAPLPQDMQELRSFLGLINYYRRFVPHLSTILAPLNELLMAERKWQWTKKCTAKAWKQLVKSPALIHYDPSLPIKLAADASSYGVGAVLSHVLPDGSEHPVAFASRTLTSAEKNYAQLEKEALAIIFGIKRFHQYLYGRKFCLITDHRPLTTILGPKDGTPQLAAARLQRWAMMLSAYSYDIVFRK